MIVHFNISLLYSSLWPKCYVLITALKCPAPQQKEKQALMEGIWQVVMVSFGAVLFNFWLSDCCRWNRDADLFGNY